MTQYSTEVSIVDWGEEFGRFHSEHENSQESEREQLLTWSDGRSLTAIVKKSVRVSLFAYSIQNFRKVER